MANIRAACRDCSLARLCLPMGLNPTDMERLDAVMSRPRPLKRGEHLFRSGDSFRSLYAVRSGSLKVYTPCQDGTEQVLGFHLPGELVGLDAVEHERHVCSAKVLETLRIRSYARALRFRSVIAIFNRF